jgi:ABC-type multidrug transport system permease subunit
MPGAARDGLRAVILLLAASLLGLPLSAPRFLAWVALEGAATGIFAALGIFATAYYLRFSRGEGAIAFGSSIAAILAGTYFPVALFPAPLQKTLESVSPFNLLIDAARAVFVDAMPWSAIGRLLAWGGLGIPLAVVAFGWSLQALRRRGSVEITT